MRAPPAAAAPPLTAPSLPHGTCPGVGIGGHATLGGFGLDSRLWGMALDAVVALQAVLADGSLVEVTAASRPDLFWALRGAGPGFAVVTAFRLATRAAPPVNINWAYTWNPASAALAAQVYQAAADWAQAAAPKELGFGILLFPGKVLTVRGVYYGSRASYNSIIAPLLAKINALAGSPTDASVQNLGWIASLTELAGEDLETPQRGYDAHDTFVSLDPGGAGRALTHSRSTSSRSRRARPRRCRSRRCAACSRTCTARRRRRARSG